MRAYVLDTDVLVATFRSDAGASRQVLEAARAHRFESLLSVPLMTSVTDPNNNVTTYTYDTENNLLSIEDANNNTTSFSYDAYSRVMQTTFPSTHYEQYGYDAANNLTSKTDRNGQRIGYVYDDLYRMTQKNYPNSTNVEYVYDLVGKLQKVTDPTGTYGFAYDNMGRLVGTTTQYRFVTGTYTNAYTYDANSNRASMTDPQGGVTSHVYDTLNRLRTLTLPTAFGSGSFGFTYDALSRRTQIIRGAAGGGLLRQGRDGHFAGPQIHGGFRGEVRG